MCTAGFGRPPLCRRSDRNPRTRARRALSCGRLDLRSGNTRRNSMRWTQWSAWLLSLACFGGLSMAADFGPNVLVFRPSMPAAEMQAQIDRVYAAQQNNQFGPARNALLFAPG